MKKGLLVTFFSFIVVLAFAQSEAKVLEKVNALTNAIFQNKDSSVLQQLVSTKVTYGHSGGNIEDKPTMIHNAMANTAVYNNFTLEPLSIFFANKKTAIVRHILRAKVSDKGTESSLNLGVLQVWAKEGRNWRIVARQAVKVPEKS
jgi:hypothetical protein